MNGWQIAGIVIGGVVLFEVLLNARDIARYLKIRSMSD